VFEACHPFAFFDYYRVPYELRPSAHADGCAGSPASLHRLWVAGQGRGDGDRLRSLLWLGTDGDMAPPGTAGPARRYQLADMTLFASVRPDADAPGMLKAFGHGWRREQPILGSDSRPAASIWRDDDGSVFLPFDPGEVMRRFWSESYLDLGRSPLTATAQRAMVRAYYLSRPMLPRRLQLNLRRAFSHVQGRASFPNWPVEDSLHDLYTWLFARLSEVAGQPVPFLGAWPDGRSWALVLTHDVETSAGIHNMELLRDIERQLGYRSSWNFVPLRYQLQDAVIRALRADGCEIGVHGLRHDGHDLGSRRLMEKRLPAMREYAERWNAAGFRSAATQRHWEWMPGLGFGYDSSYTDTDPYEPQPGGCCTYLPYFNQKMVELPITLPQDHTVFCVLGASDTELWMRKAERLRERHSMALALTHPDYAVDTRVREAYRKLLESFQRDAAVWHALPAEVAEWWRQRDASRLRRDGSSWRIEGPAATKGQVRFAAANDAVRC
jgi:peptidoglycan/xylan/chitin deacetylase (PgdA/CDA1 family)